MGTMDIELVKKAGIDVEKLIEKLNKAYSDEWLAHYQYWLGAKLAVGFGRVDLVAEMEEHAEDEKKHAGMVAERIIQLGGTPVVEPKDWYKFSTCGYDAPADPSTKTLLAQNIKGEQCAISVYREIMTLTRGHDVATFDMAKHIYMDEVEHEQDLQDLEADWGGK